MNENKKFADEETIKLVDKIMEDKLSKPVPCLQCEKTLVRMSIGTECNDIRIKCDDCNTDFLLSCSRKSEKRCKISKTRVSKYRLAEYENPVDMKCQSEGCNHTLFTAYKGSKAKNLKVYCQSCGKWSTFDFEM